MHVLGKVFMWFAFLLIIAAVVLTTLTLKVRNRWKGELSKAMAAAKTSSDQLTTEEVKTRSLVEQNSLLQHSWGDAWMADRSGPQGQGAIDIGVGSSKGLGQQQQAQGKEIPNLHVFAVTGPEESQYLGEFKVAQLGADTTTGQLARPLRPGQVPAEDQTWPTGQYRVRMMLPEGWASTTVELDSSVLKSHRYLVACDEQLKLLNKQIEESQKSLDQRLAELNGDAEAPEGSEQEVIEGFVAAVRRLELERNSVLAHVDELRHELNDQYVKLRETMDENTQMSKKMEQDAKVQNEPVQNGPRLSTTK